MIGEYLQLLDMLFILTAVKLHNIDYIIIWNSCNCLMGFIYKNPKISA